MKSLRNNLFLKTVALLVAVASLTACVIGVWGYYYKMQNNINPETPSSYYDTAYCDSTSRNYAHDVLHFYVSSSSPMEVKPSTSNFGYRIFDENMELAYASDYLPDGAVKTYPIELQQDQDISIVDDNGDSYIQTLSTPYTVEIHIADPITAMDNYYATYTTYQLALTIIPTLTGLLSISSALFLVSILYLLCAAGHKRGVEGITPNIQDKIPLDLYAFCACSLFFLGVYATAAMQYSYYIFYLPPLFASLAFSSLVAIGSLLTLATRLKMTGWWKNTIIYFVLHKCWNILALIGNTAKDALSVLPLTWKVAVAWVVIAFFYMFGGFMAMLLNIAILCYLLIVTAQMQQLRKAGEQLASGNLSFRVDTKKMFAVFKRHGNHLNSISEGATLAVEQRMKSERLKTELITNVSHDIKTPLTSIINYVDLLKKTELPETAREYVDVLDRQSARLSKLTTDLLEASKASTGNVQTNLVETDLVELVNQAVAEYQTKLEQAQLTVVVNAPNAPLIAMLDGTLTWRVLNNLLSNATKYSQTNTRIYIDIAKKNQFAVISVKNISKDSLNINADDLMERFVRGDSSRSTEGSGLGLNIAKSLVEVQKGSLALSIDGDLFKATIAFPVANVGKKQKEVVAIAKNPEPAEMMETIETVEMEIVDSADITVDEDLK